jgi:glycosyltransferase involved in cell wall biosynthesis
MRAEIERFSGLLTVLFPHPVLAAQPPEEKAEHPRDSAEPKGKTNVGPKEGNRSEAEQKLKAETMKKDGTTKDTTPARQRIAQGEVECVGWEPTGAKRSEGHKKREEVSTTIERQGGREDPGGWVAARETAEGSLQGETPWEGANQQQPKVGPKGEGVGTTKSNGTEALDAGRSALNTPAKPVVVVAPGFARYEKGSDLMQAAIRLVLQKAETLKLEKLKSLDAGRSTLDSYASCSPLPALRFVLQWPEDFDLPDGRRCGPNPDLLKDERVKFSKDLLTGEAYWDFLQQADVIVLPYRSESYRARVSRVAIEAAMLGKPMVYTKGTWISEVVAMGGAGVAIAEETPQSLAEAIQMAIGDLDTLQSEAERGVARVRNFYSVSSFHHLLVEVGENKKSNIAE